MLLVPTVLWHQWEQGAVHHFERRTTLSSKARLRVWLCVFGCNWFSAYLSMKYALHKYWIPLSAFRYSGCSDIKDSHIHSVGCPSSKNLHQAVLKASPCDPTQTRPARSPELKWEAVGGCDWNDVGIGSKPNIFRLVLLGRWHPDGFLILFSNVLDSIQCPID